MNKNKKEGILIVTVLLVVFLSSSIIALGVAIPYWDSPEWFPLKLAPGESDTVILTLQNTENIDLTLEAKVTSEIAILEDVNNVYSVPSGEINKPVRIRVSIPADAVIGTKYDVMVSFDQISSGEGGMLRVAGALAAKFPVEVVGTEDSILKEERSVVEPEETTKKLWMPVILILIIIVLVALIRRNKK